MARGNTITLGQRTFTSQQAAVDYFMEKRAEVMAGGEFSSGEFFEELRELFTRYCENSPGWELNGRLVTHFYVEGEKRQVNGRWVEHPCYKARLSNGERRVLSVEKAVRGVVAAARKSAAGGTSL